MNKTAYTKKHWGAKHVYKDPLSDVAVYPESADPKLQQQAKETKAPTPAKLPKKNEPIIEPNIEWAKEILNLVKNGQRGKGQVLIGNRLYKVDARPIGENKIRTSFKEYTVKEDDCESFETSGEDSPAFKGLSEYYLHTNTFDLPLSVLSGFLAQATRAWPEKSAMVPDIMKVKENFINNYCPSCGKYNKTSKNFPVLCDNCELKAMEEGEDTEPDTDEELDDEHVGCENCGKTVHIDDSCSFGDYMYCEQCFNKIAADCTNCGKTIEKGDDDSHLKDDGWYCDNCFHEKFSLCDNCGDYEPSDKFVQVGSEHYCEICANDFPKCPVCNKKIDTHNESYKENAGKFFHSKCFISGIPKILKYWPCEGCAKQVKIPEDKSEIIKNLQKKNKSIGIFCDKCAGMVSVVDSNDPIKNLSVDKLTQETANVVFGAGVPKITGECDVCGTPIPISKDKLETINDILLSEDFDFACSKCSHNKKSSIFSAFNHEIELDNLTPYALKKVFPNAFWFFPCAGGACKGFIRVPLDKAEIITSLNLGSRVFCKDCNGEAKPIVAYKNGYLPIDEDISAFKHLYETGKAPQKNFKCSNCGTEIVVGKDITPGKAKMIEPIEKQLMCKKCSPAGYGEPSIKTPGGSPVAVSLADLHYFQELYSKPLPKKGEHWVCKYNNIVYLVTDVDGGQVHLVEPNSNDSFGLDMKYFLDTFSIKQPPKTLGDFIKEKLSPLPQPKPLNIGEQFNKKLHEEYDKLIEKDIKEHFKPKPVKQSEPEYYIFDEFGNKIKKDAGIKQWFEELSFNKELNEIKQALIYIGKVLHAAKSTHTLDDKEKIKLERTRKLLGDASISWEIPMKPEDYNKALILAKKINKLDPYLFETSHGTVLELEKTAAIGGNNFMRDIALSYDLPDILNELADFYSKSVSDFTPEDVDTWGGEKKENSERRVEQLKNLAQTIESQEDSYDDPLEYMEEEAIPLVVRK